MARDGAFRRRHNIPERTTIALYVGSMGRKQGLTGVVSAASLTRDANICWVLTGDGESYGELVEAVRAGGLEDTVRFVPFQPEAEIASMLADADILLLNQISAVKDTVIPSKLLTYMAAGRPVLAAVKPSS